MVAMGGGCREGRKFTKNSPGVFDALERGRVDIGLVKEELEFVVFLSRHVPSDKAPCRLSNS